MRQGERLHGRVDKGPEKALPFVGGREQRTPIIGTVKEADMVNICFVAVLSNKG